MKPIIQAAVDSGRPPLELILDQPGRKRGKWDGKLIKALYLEKNFQVEGFPIWVEESSSIKFVSKKTTIRSQKVVEEAQEKHSKKKNPKKGVRFYAEAELLPGEKWPTREEWLERKKTGTVKADLDDDKLRKRADEADERAAGQMTPEAERILAEFTEKFKPH